MLPLPLWDLMKVYINALQGTLLSRGTPKRTRDLVSMQYDQGSWGSFLQSKRWEKVNSLHDLLIPPTEEERIALVEGRIVRINRKEYAEYRIGKLFQIVCTFLSDEGVQEDRQLIELGCGWGMNLFSLRESGLRYKLVGVDVSRNAIVAAQSINERFKTAIKFRQTDFLLEDLDSASDIVLTYYCMEQLKYDIEAALNQICSWSPKHVIHIEPVIEMYRSWRIRDLASMFYIRSCDYQGSLLTTLQKLEGMGKLRITQVRRLGFAANPLNEGTLIAWKPR